jgi:transcription initiation factor TFIIIB Brf1 subunit/transcription initiation factor TFIIB
MPSSLGLASSEEHHLKALDMILEAWEEGTESGIPPEMMAYAALYTALTDLVGTYGEAHVVRMVEGLKPRLERGEFTVYRSTQ